MARAARDRGAEVYVMTNVNRFAEPLAAEGFHVIPWTLRRGSLHPLRELRALGEVIRAFRTVRPDLVHHVALKPVLYGTLARMACCRVPVVNAINGLGTVFAGRSIKTRMLRPFMRTALRYSLRQEHSVTVFQTGTDLDMLFGGLKHGHKNIAIIRGAGVDIAAFAPSCEPQGRLVILLPCRMMWDKGVAEFVNTARLLRRYKDAVRFVLVGDTDPENPTGIPRRQLEAWSEEGLIEWWGHRDDMPSVFAQAHIVCLPSHMEGVPKALIEAAACGRPIVATNVGGIPEIVRSGENGLLVPAGNVAALTDALELLITDPRLRQRMGRRGRQIAVEEFSEALVIDQTLEVYRRLTEEPQRCNEAHLVATSYPPEEH